MLLLTVTSIPASEFVSALRFCACISLFFTALSMSMLLLYLGACNALPKRWNYCPVHEDEPCPRAVRWTYPENLEPGKRHWFLVHVAETKLLDQHYVASISQYVGQSSRPCSAWPASPHCCRASHCSTLQVLTAQACALSLRILQAREARAARS